MHIVSTSASSSSKMNRELRDIQTLKELKTNLKCAFKKTGVLDSVKAQIRKEFISSLTDKFPKGKGFSESGLDLRERLSLSIIYHFLKHRNYNHSVSVFAAECGLDSKSAWLSEMDIVRSLQFGTQTDIYRLIVDKENQNDSNNSALHERKQSVFDILLDHLSSDKSKRINTEISVQTENSLNVRGLRESLEFQVQNLRSNFIIKRDAEKSSPTKSIEERMIQFQRECEERYRRDTESYLNYMKETEISKVRLEEAQKARTEVEITRNELESEYQRRLYEHTERETLSNRAMVDRDRLIQQSQYDSRQHMQREIDDLRNREKTMIRKNELESQGLQTLELRLKEVKIILESREREVDRREKTVEDLYTENLDRAKSDARSHMRSELEDLNRDKNSFRIDIQKFEDIKSSQAILLESATTTRRSVFFYRPFPICFIFISICTICNFYEKIFVHCTHHNTSLFYHCK